MVLGRAGPAPRGGDRAGRRGSGRHAQRDSNAVGASKPIPPVRRSVTDDATLSDFGVETTDDEDEDADADRGASDGGDPESAGGTDGSTAADAATESDRDDRPNAGLSTYAWGDYACSRCGRESERVWRDDGAFVCPDCKEW